MSQAKHWCFTINNYTQDEIDHLRGLYEASAEEKKIRYLVFQQEKGENETPHLQGYISYSKRYRLGPVKEMVGNRAHLEVSRGTPTQNRDYCTKEDTRVENTHYEEFGDFPGGSGTRSDLEEFKEAVRGGCLDLKVLRDEHSEVMAKYRQWAHEFVSDNTPMPEIPEHPLNEWQLLMDAKLSEEPNDREIMFIVDAVGNKGKTWYAKHYCRKVDTAFLLEPSKKADMAYALPSNVTHLFVNLTRSQAETSEYLYSFLESVKDGVIFSSKYHSEMKHISNCHVIVMMNTNPMEHLLSTDRITKITI